MRVKLLLTVLFVAVIAGCMEDVLLPESSFVTRSRKVYKDVKNVSVPRGVEPFKLVGVYYKGDRLGSNLLLGLNGDGSSWCRSGG